jgi:hypothetical protein
MEARGKSEGEGGGDARVWHHCPTWPRGDGVRAGGFVTYDIKRWKWKKGQVTLLEAIITNGGQAYHVSNSKPIEQVNPLCTKPLK